MANLLRGNGQAIAQAAGRAATAAKVAAMRTSGQAVPIRELVSGDADRAGGLPSATREGLLGRGPIDHGYGE